MSHTQEKPYSLDVDASGIRLNTSAAIIAALSYGASNINKPPEGHWLSEFWQMARGERAQRDELLKAFESVQTLIPAMLNFAWITEAEADSMRNAIKNAKAKV